ncbi:STT3 domain-containing protein [Thermococcus sp. JdF3]|uniref:STT3 domain-containing protein n=1 Tax=Thermococcus sp. JdF3 TaxID=1638258 RepID=UPI001F0E2567|nr:STT3 domain-containing protein [Thermococcus sp. JdF3]
MASFLYRKLIEPKFAAPIIAVIALALRLIPMRFRYLLGYDPYFHLAYIRYALERGEWVNFITYAGGPWGYQISRFHPLGLWMTPAYFYKFLSLFGVSLYNAFRITPVVFGVLTVLFTYLALLRLYGKREAFLSAFFLAVSFGHVFRSMAGYYRGDNYMLFLYSAALLGMALALSKKSPSWRYKRLAFYLLPGLFAGLSAAFWQAYYPIFGLLLANAVMVSAGAFLLGRDRYITDGIVMALSSALGALMANWLGGRFGYGMVAYSRWLGKKLAEELGMQFGFIKDLFLLIYVEYAVPLTLLVLVALLAFSKFVKEKKVRAAIVAIGAAVTLWVGIRYYGVVNEALLRLFPASPISETQRTTLGDWWEAYGIAGLLVPLFTFRFLKRPRMGDFLLLGTALVMIPMAVVWTRFLFIASLAVALMTGTGLVALYDTAGALIESLGDENKRKWLSAALSLLLIGVPLISAYQGTSTTLSVHPFMTGEWESALTYLGGISNPNDVVMTWWDQGHWVTYYSMRSPVAQGGPSGWVAKYYLGLVNEKGLMNPGVDYVIVSYDTVMKFGAVVETAGVDPGKYALVVLRREAAYGNILVFSNGPYSLMAAPGEVWDVKVNLGGKIIIPKRVFVESGGNLGEVPLSSRPTADVYAYVNINYGYAVIMNGNAFNTTLAKLMFTKGYPADYDQVYSDGGMVKIFRFKHPNVVVTVGNGSVVLRFTNATGTGIGIYGYLGNGTLVFKKWYGVKGKDEFLLPDNLNGSVVIRYTYVQKKTVLDRGVFRIDDVLCGVCVDR